MRVLGELWTGGGFTLALFQGWGVGSEVLLVQVRHDFSFRNKFLIVIGSDSRGGKCLLRGTNWFLTYSRLCLVFKSLIAKIVGKEFV